jgi:putative hydrolase of the HAD superfamily
MIKAAIFDYGGVISLPLDPNVPYVQAKMTGAPAALFETVYDTYRFDFDRGLISGAQMYALMLKDAGYPEQARNAELMRQVAWADMVSWRRLNDKTVAWGLSLKKQGYQLGILSNMPHEFLDQYEKEIPLFVEADYACFSCRVRLIKPEEAIYRDALRGLGVEPQEAVFFDDMPVNIEAANRLGIHGVLWTGLENAQREWEKINAAE